MIRHGERGEQGCPLMPALFSLALQNSLVEVDGELFVSFDVEGIVDCNLHPSRLQSVFLDWISVLVSLRSLLPVTIFSVYSDPAVVFTKESVSLAPFLPSLGRFGVWILFGERRSHLRLRFHFLDLGNVDMEVVRFGKFSFVTVERWAISTFLLVASLYI